jgi:HEPN domain-containing protein
MPPHDELREWVRIAADDLTAARQLAASGLLNVGCFHCQQAIEKLLKAWLLWRGAQAPRTHDLALLFEQCAGLGAGFLDHRDAWEWVTGFAVTIRYPSEVPTPDQAETDRALRAASECWDVITAEFPAEVLP